MADDQPPELIEHEMEQTRQSLTDKVAALEQQVTGTIQSVSDGVKETVESVRSAMQDTVSSVKETVSGSVESVSEGVKQAFDVSHHVRDNPWVAVGSAAAAGFVLGLLTGKTSNRRSVYGEGLSEGHSSTASLMAQTPRGPSSAEPVRSYEPAERPSRRPGWLDELLELAGQEVKKLGSQAIAQLSASFKQNIEQGVPKLLDTAMERVQGAAAGRSSSAGQPTAHQPPPGRTGPYGPQTGV